jgi:ribosomal protection tetracycline resistance protein
VSHTTLNLGILAHVDAGKTTLTERLLYEAGVIAEPGSVDAGTTQTDSLALERQRGITIRSAVASFSIGDVHVNLIDTPGHPDFIAEVERVLGVLDGAVIVISAVEGVQPQTRILMRALQRLRIPTLIFVNKIDRLGADADRTLGSIRERLTPAVVPMGTVHGLGGRGANVVPYRGEDTAFLTRTAEVLAEQDDRMLAAYVERDYDGVPDGLALLTSRALVHPLFFGSAMTGAGVEPLATGIAELLPASDGDPNGPVTGTVFKIERGDGGEKIAYVRMFSGTVHVRDRLGEDKVTSLEVFERGPAVPRSSVAAGGVAKVRGLANVRVGDRIGGSGEDGALREFAPPTLEAVVVARDPGDGAGLRVALAQLAEQDPLIDVHRDDDGRLSVLLYGDVQREVIEATLAADYGLGVTFCEAAPLYVERPIGTAEAVEVLHAESNPFNATLGLSIAPASPGSGVAFGVLVDAASVPLYVYKIRESFVEHMDAYVREALSAGLFGWPVTDCVVRVTRCAYSVPDGPPSRRGPLSTAADFRKLTPIVLGQALARAGTVVCEPTVRARVELPSGAIGTVMPALARLGAVVDASSPAGDLMVVEAVLSAVRARDLQRGLPSLTGGEGVLESTFAGYQPVVGAQPRRA